MQHEIQSNRILFMVKSTKFQKKIFQATTSERINFRNVFCPAKNVHGYQKMRVLIYILNKISV